MQFPFFHETSEMLGEADTGIPTVGREREKGGGEVPTVQQGVGQKGKGHSSKRHQGGVQGPDGAAPLKMVPYSAEPFPPSEANSCSYEVNATPFFFLKTGQLQLALSYSGVDLHKERK